MAASNDDACARVRSLLSDYLDEELAPTRRAVMAAHLGLCAGCARFAAELAATIRALHALRPSAALAERGFDLEGT